MAADLTIKRNDLSPTLTLIAEDAVGPVALDGGAAVFHMVSVLNGAIKVNAPATVAAAMVFTAAGATFTSNNHGLNNGERVTLTSVGSLPPPLIDEVSYYVINATQHTFQLSLTAGGTAITTTGAGSGPHSLLTGRVNYEWQSGDTDTAGTYACEVQVTIGGKQRTYPNGSHFYVEVISDLV